MGTFATASKNTMLDTLTITHMSLHDGDPSTTGTNEISGGSPAYARKAATINAAAAGSRALNADVTFVVPASTTVKYVGYWTALTGGTFHGSDLVTNESYEGQGEYKVLASGTTLTISDPA